LTTIFSSRSALASVVYRTKSELALLLYAIKILAFNYKIFDAHERLRKFYKKEAKFGIVKIGLLK